jgi:hypothetical protein
MVLGGYCPYTEQIGSFYKVRGRGFLSVRVDSGDCNEASVIGKSLY